MGSWPGGYGLEILYPPSEENFSIEIEYDKHIKILWCIS